MLRYLTLIFYGVFGIGCIYAFLLIFCFSTFKIPSDSMEPQLQTGLRSGKQVVFTLKEGKAMCTDCRSG